MSTESEVKTPTRVERKGSGDRLITDSFNSDEIKALEAMKLKLPPPSPRRSPTSSPSSTSSSSSSTTSTTVVHEDHTLMRFLRARSLDVSLATDMYLSSLLWRRQNNIDSVASSPAPTNFRILQQCVPQEWHGFCKSGRPILIQKIGQMHLDHFTRFETESIDECHTYMMELGQALMRASSARSGTRVSQKVIILDLKGLGLSHRRTIRFMRGTSHIDKNFYPETLGQLFMINAPRVAPVLWSMIKPMLDPKTQAKVQILGSDYAKTLKEFVSLDQLPKEYGGTCTCKGTTACIPEYAATAVKKAMTEYVSRRKITASIIEATVGARARLDLPFEVTSSKGQDFQYSFSTAKNDIQFAVEFTPSSSSSTPSKSGKDEIKAPKPLVLVESSKVTASADSPNTGVVSVPNSGTVRFIFDNNHSRFSSKTIYYSITALAPSDDVPLPEGVAEAEEEKLDLSSSSSSSTSSSSSLSSTSIPSLSL